MEGCLITSTFVTPLHTGSAESYLVRTNHVSWQSFDGDDPKRSIISIMMGLSLSPTQTLKWQACSSCGWSWSLFAETSQGEKGRFVQQQPPHSGMGLTPGNVRFCGVCTPHQGTCPLASKAQWDLPHNSTTHCGGGELNDGYPLTLAW